jgi:hypothetical protein
MRCELHLLVWENHFKVMATLPSPSQTTSDDEDDISLADIAETATLRGTPTASRTSRAGSTSTVKASISIEAPEGTANEKTIRSTSVPPNIVQEST